MADRLLHAPFDAHDSPANRRGAGPSPGYGRFRGRIKPYAYRRAVFVRRVDSFVCSAQARPSRVIDALGTAAGRSTIVVARTGLLPDACRQLSLGQTCPQFGIGGSRLVHLTTREGKILTTDSLNTEVHSDVESDVPADTAQATEPNTSSAHQTTFADLGILPDIAAALADVGIVHPFPIQQMSIPVALTGADLIGQARTGTGKTLAFGTTLLQRIVVPTDPDYEFLAEQGAPQALVVTPTRELASQVGRDLQTASTRRRARVLTIYGGTPYDDQLATLKAGVDVVVGTPGRLLDLADRGALNLAHIKVLVLDEADEMLDLGFLPDVERILAKTPELRQTMLFSATMPSAIVSLARQHLRHPLNIRAESAGETSTVPATAQFVYQAHDLDKPEVVARILQAESRDRVMIFCRTKRTAQRVTDDLVDRGFAAASIHGDLSQVVREKALKRFRDGKVNTLVATDVAARGIDVTGVTHVINYECPDDDKTYVHRIGRTGRAGASGVAITFVDWADLTRWKVINNALGLPFEEPQETYSTSEHLFHDLGIDPASKGRIAPPKEEAEEPREHKRDRSRPKHTRSRVRMRNGVPVGEGAAAKSAESSSAETGDTATATQTTDKPRRRRRRRTSSPDPS